MDGFFRKVINVYDDTLFFGDPMKKRKILFAIGITIIIISSIAVSQNRKFKNATQVKIFEMIGLTEVDFSTIVVKESFENEPHGEMEISIIKNQDKKIKEQLEKYMGETFDTEYAFRVNKNQVLWKNVESKTVLHVYQQFMEGQRAKTVEVYAFLCEDGIGQKYLYIFY